MSQKAILETVLIMPSGPAIVCTGVGAAYGGRWVSDGVRVTRQTL